MVFCAFTYATAVNGTLNSQKYQDELRESDVIPSFNSPEGQNMVLQDDNARSQRTRTKTYTASLVFHDRACHRT